MTAYIVGALLFIIGFALNYFINRKQFNRRNMFGVEGFKSYEHAVSSNLIERLGKLIGWLLILGGLFFIFLAWYNDKFAKDYQDEHRKEQQVKP